MKREPEFHAGMVRPPPDFGPLFGGRDDDAIKGMVRSADVEEPRIAAHQVEPGRRALQERIFAILQTEGPQTDRELEEREDFKDYGPSTVRKRRSELFYAGRIARCGQRDKLALWEVIR